MERTVIRNGFVASQDPKLGDQDGMDVLIEADEIVAVERSIQVADAHEIDASGFIVMPGFVDAHKHIWQGAMRGVCADWSILDYLTSIRMNAARFYAAEDMYAAHLHGGLEALNAGVTTVTDYCHNILTPDHAHEAIRGVAESGLRTIWNYGFNFPPSSSPFFRSLQQRVDFATELAGRYFTSRDNLVTLGIAPEEARFAGSEQALDTQIDTARNLDARIFWHCNGTTVEPPREVAGLHERGKLGEDMLLVHMTGTEDDEWQMLADAGASVVFTPDTELQMGIGWPSNDKARRYGVTQAYGTDIVSNNSADMFATIRVGVQAMRRRQIDREGALPTGVPFSCQEALAWGTSEAAKAVGLDDRVGSIKPGKQADIILIDGTSLSMVGWDRHNVASAIVLQAQSVDVDTVWVAGKLAKRHGTMLADTSRACGLLVEAKERIRERVEAVGGFHISPEEAQKRMLAVSSTEHGEYDFS